jgi:peptide/nickel transport system substrate-binding protein
MPKPLLRRTFSLAVAIAAASATLGCDRQSQGIVEVQVIGDAPRLADPRRGPLSASEAVLIANAAQGLVRFDAGGQIVPGLAETWNVSDDGLSYIFRLTNVEWPNGRRVTAEQVARMLRRMIASSSRDPLRDTFGAVDEIVAMTDRVLEIRLTQTRPHLLQLLAQPEMGLVYDGLGSGPFAVGPAGREGALRLIREVPVSDEEEPEREELIVSADTAEKAVRRFVAGQIDLVLGGTFTDLPLAHRARLTRRALQFDPAMGLFGLMPARTGGPLAIAEVRRLLSEAIDREALVAALAVPGLVPRATVLEPKLDNLPDPVAPQWAATPIAERRPVLIAEARRLFGEDEPPVVRLSLPDGPGAEVLLTRLRQDWGVLGVQVERSGDSGPADLVLVDKVAPSSSSAWFLRQFRCEVARICDEQVDEMLDGARATAVLAQRRALLFEASKRIDGLPLFLPIAAPIRWSLVSPRISGFTGNPFAVHTLTGLERRPDRIGE